MIIHIALTDPAAPADAMRWTCCGVRYAWRDLHPRGDWHHDAIATTREAVRKGERYWRLNSFDTLCAACVGAERTEKLTDEEAP
jgi:hypothetical protein